MLNTGLIERSPFVSFVIKMLQDDSSQEEILEAAKLKFKNSCIEPHNVSQVAKAFTKGVYNLRETVNQPKEESVDDANLS